MRGIGALAACALLTVLTACGDQGAVTGHRAAHVALPHPTTLKLRGTTYRVGLASSSGATTSDDGVTLYAFSMANPDRPQCSYLKPSARLVHESADEVRIATFDYEKRPRPRGDVECGFVFTDNESPYVAMPIRLARPLGDRRLVDERSGRVIAVLSPSYEPTVSGEVLAGYHRVVSSHSRPEEGFTAVVAYSKGQISVEVEALSPSVEAPFGKVVGHPDVHGVRATLTSEHGRHCVSWVPESPAFEVCSSGGASRPSDDFLVKVARAVR